MIAKVKKIGFIYTIEHVGADGQIKSIEHVKNVVPSAGVDYIVGAAFKGASQYTSWYLGAYEASRTPLVGDTMVSLLADCTESAAYTITGGARPTISFPAVSGGAVATVASPNVLAFTTPATIRGAFITTNSVWRNNAGLLVSAVLFPSPKVLAAGESLRVPVGFALV